MAKASLVASSIGLFFATVPFHALAVAQTASTAAGPQAQPASVAPGPNATYEDQKKFAVSLFNQQLAIEALPLFEDLSRQNPADSGVLLGLGACLIQHSATLKDEGAARSERIRARQILLRAQQLGNNSPLLLNLLDVLPADGSLHYSGAPEVAAAIAEGETAFAKNDYATAIKAYSKAFELDPNNYGAALFNGDCYFAMRDIPKAAEWYERAIAINPDTETAYRYESDMYTKQGDQEKARLLAIKAVIAEPYSQKTWRGLAQWANANGLKLTPIKIKTGSEVSGADGKNTSITINVNGNKNAMEVWLIYSGARMNWQKEEFKKHYPQETAYRHTLMEEVEALTTAASVLKSQKPGSLESDPSLSALKKLSEAGMLEPYVLLGASDNGIAVDYVAYRAENRAKLEAYLSTYVVPPPPAKPAAVP